MNIFSAILIGISTNLDNLCLAMLIGSKGGKLTLGSNMFISLISGAAALAAAGAAEFILPERIAGVIGAALIIFIGIVTLATAARGSEKDGPEKLGIKKTILLGIVLAINCLPVAFGAGAAGESPILLSSGVAVFSAISMGTGVYMGRRLTRRLKPGPLNAVSGLLLILMGVTGLFR